MSARPVWGASPVWFGVVLCLALLGAPESAGGQEEAGNDRAPDACGAEPVGTVTTPMFLPLLAHSKEPRTFASIVQESSESLSAPIMAMGLGDYALESRRISLAGGHISFGLAAAVFARFDMSVETFDFVDADFIVGVPVSYRRGWASARLRLYHQSSHLGDDFVSRTPGTRNGGYDFESIEWVGSADLRSLRVYAGGEYRLRRTPRTLNPASGQLGMEWRPREVVAEVGRAGGLRFVAAAHFSSWETSVWSPSRSVRAGLELGPLTPESSTRRVAVLASIYMGPQFRGRLFSERTTVFGLGLYVAARR